MSWTLFGGILASLAALMGGFVWFGKYLSKKFDKTEDQTNQEIAKSHEARKNAEEEQGRPVE